MGAELPAVGKLKGELAEEVHALELARLDEWTLHMSQLLPAGGQLAVKAVLALVKISERRCKLLPLEHAQQVAVNGTLNLVPIKAALEALTDEELLMMRTLAEKAQAAALPRVCL